ncbi:hypothetical protein UY3_08420 [Chelonia mydas]|uniref:Uncharacterized protein n=1 Tax=Chelonia mydas TaxID=8469 RepID=M7B8Z6_CHEMY|nr:hypothetical protein UY3_08420 [Chelonia mydas]
MPKWRLLGPDLQECQVLKTATEDNKRCALNIQVTTAGYHSKRSSSWTTVELLHLLRIWGEEAVQSQLRLSCRNFDTYGQISQGLGKKGHAAVQNEDKGAEAGLEAAERGPNPEDEVIDEEVELDNNVELPVGQAAKTCSPPQEVSSQSQQLFCGEQEVGREMPGIMQNKTVSYNHWNIFLNEIETSE